MTLPNETSPQFKSANIDAFRMQDSEDDGDLSSQAPPSWRTARNAAERDSHSVAENSDDGDMGGDLGGRLRAFSIRSTFQGTRNHGVGQAQDLGNHDIGDFALGTSMDMEESYSDYGRSSEKSSFETHRDASHDINGEESVDRRSLGFSEEASHHFARPVSLPLNDDSHDMGEVAIPPTIDDDEDRHASVEPERVEVSHDGSTTSHDIVQTDQAVAEEPSPPSPVAQHAHARDVSEWSHQQLAPQRDEEEEAPKDDEWQEMPVYAPFDIYDDDGKLFAKEDAMESGVAVADSSGPNLGGAAKGYTRVQIDEDAQSATSMDENTAYLFKEPGTTVDEDDEEQRDPTAQMQATKNLLTDNQRIAYVGVVRLAMAEMTKELRSLPRTRSTKKDINFAYDAMVLWGQKMMVRIYSHMELEPAEQIMIEQLAEHGLQPADLTPALMQNSRVKNPASNPDRPENGTPEPVPAYANEQTRRSSDANDAGAVRAGDASEPPPYEEIDGAHMPEARTPSQLPTTDKLDIDLRWTVLCDLFLILVADSVYDARSRALLERVGAFLDVPWLDICRFEKRVTDALEMQEAANKENWDEAEHMESRKKRARKRRLMFMGLATVGGGIVIGLSAGLLAPVIGAGLAAGFTTIGVTGTSTFLAGAGGAAVIGTGAAGIGGTIGGRAAQRRTGAVKTFEYRPLHNNKRVNLIVTVAGWMNGKVDDVRLPYSTVDPIMGDVYSILWEPEMLRSMGDTINILATEALTQGLQQILGSTILISLMAALQLPIVLTKLSYLIDNPWSVSQAKADMAGLILADSLIDRNLGARPITLVGFSLGSRVIFSCLKELAKRGAVGIVQNAYLFGSPVVVNKDDYLRAKTVVSGRFVNGFARNDWILGYLFRATSGGIMRVAGLAAIDIPGIENIDVTEFVPGHMAYRKAMPRVLREVGWAIENDDFTEIEDPDPDNHDKRQRELINEIEEARKELQDKGEKRRFGNFFRTNKKRAQKKDWETYDERSKELPQGGEPLANSGVLFDIEAIRKEAVELAAQGTELRHVDTTLGPMKNENAAAQSPTAAVSGSNNGNSNSLRTTKSFEDAASATDNYKNSAASRSADFNHYDEYDEEAVTMTFDSPAPRRVGASSSAMEQPQWSYHNGGSSSSQVMERGGIDANHRDVRYDESEDEPSMSFEPPERTRSPPSQWDSVRTSRNDEPDWQGDDLSVARRATGQADTFRSRVPSYKSQPANVWADDEDDLGQEREMEMTFE